MATTKRKRQGTDKLPFAKILKRIMESRGLSIGAIAEMAGVSRSVVQSWTSQANPHDLQAVGRLARALNMHLRELLLDEQEHKEGVVTNLDTLFDSHEIFEGLCKVNIQRLVPKKEK